MKLRFVGAARAELDAAIDFYDRQAPGLGEDFIVDVEAATARVTENARLPPVYIDETRRFLAQAIPLHLGLPHHRLRGRHHRRSRTSSQGARLLAGPSLNGPHTAD